MKQLTLLFLFLISCLNMNARGGCWPAITISKPTPQKISLSKLVDTIKVVLNPGDSTIVFGVSEFESGTCSFSDIHWFKNGNPIGDNFECSTAGAGVYKLNVNVFIKGNFEITIIVTSSATTAVDELTINSTTNFILAPNPNMDGLFTIEREIALQPCLITVYDLNGRIIKEQKMIDKHALVDISTFDKGMYVLELTLGNGLKRRQKMIFD